MTTTTAATPAAESTLEAPVPERIEVRDALMQDMVMAGGIRVDRYSPKPVAVFENFLVEGGNAYKAGRAHEALVIAQRQGLPPKLAHVRPDATSSTGWAAEFVLMSHTPSEVFVLSYSHPAVKEDGLNSIWCVVICNDRVLYSRLGSDGRTWGKLEEFYKGGVDRARGLNYSYGSSTEKGGMHFLWSRLAVQAASSGKFLEVALNTNNGNPNLQSKNSSTDWADSGQFAVTGRLGLCRKNGSPAVWIGSGNKAGKIEKVTAPTRDFRIIGSVQTNTGNYAEHFLVETGSERSIRLWQVDDSSGTPKITDRGKMPFPEGVGIRQVKVNLHWNPQARYGHSEELALVNLYALDEKGSVWLVKQDPEKRLEPRWLPAVPVDHEVAALDVVPALADRQTAMFHTHTGQADGLKMQIQDYARNKDVQKGSGHWREVDVHEPSREVFELPRHRVEAVVSTKMGVPAPRVQVTLSAASDSSSCEVFANGVAFRVTPESPAHLTTDAQGRIWVAVTPTGLSAPKLKLTAGSVTQPFQPGRALYTYLAGSGKLNPANPGGGWGVFDADGVTLKKMLKEDNPSLTSEQARAAATAIREAATKGLEMSEMSLGDQAPQGVASGAAGMWVSLPDDGPWETRILDDREELDALVAEHAMPGGIFGDAWHLAGDAWRAIKDGGAKILSAGFDWIKKKVSLVVQWIGTTVKQGIDLVFRGIEEAGHFIMGILRKVGAVAKKVLNWLKAVFNWGHIWNTKMAFEKQLKALGPNINGGLDRAKTAIDAWLQEQQNNVSANIDAACQQAGSTKLSEVHASIKKRLPGVAGDPSSAPGPQQNWLMDTVSAAAPAKPRLEEPNLSGTTLFDQLKNAASDFADAAKNLYQAMRDYLEDPVKLKTKTVADLLKAVKSFTVGLLKTARALVDALFDLLKKTVAGCTNTMTSKLQLGPLNKLWEALARAAGHERDSDLTLSSMFCLLAAVPVTIAHKLLKGPDAQLFPDGRASFTDDGQPADEAAVKACRAAAGLLTIIAVPVAIAGDFLGDQAPWWLGLGLFLWAILGAGLGQAGMLWKTVTSVGVAGMSVLAGLIVLGAGAIAVFFWQRLNNLWSANKKFLPILLTVFGAGSLAWSVWSIASGRITGEAVYASLLGTLSLLFSFLTYEAVRTSTEEASVPVKALISSLGGITSGGLNWDLAMKS